MDLNDRTNVQTEKIRVSIETRSWTIIGTVHTPIMSYRSRLSDLLNQKDATFLSVADADVYRYDQLNEPVYSTEYLAVNLDSIELVRPVAQ